MPPKPKTSFAAYALPFMAFMIAGWYGLASVVQSKRDLRAASRGLGAVEEMDPVERMRMRYGLGGEGGATNASVAAKPTITSLEDELASIHNKVDIHNFDYKPVPREDEEDV